MVLEGTKLFEGIGAIELRVARAVFVIREKNKAGTASLIAILSLYVDDGRSFGDPRGPRLQRIKEKVDSTFNIKHWKSLGRSQCRYVFIWMSTSTVLRRRASR